MGFLGSLTLGLLIVSGGYYVVRSYARRDNRVVPYLALLRKYHHYAGILALCAGIGHALLYKYPVLSARAYSGYAALAILAGMSVIGFGIKLNPRNKNFRMLHRFAMVLLIVAVIVHLVIKKLLQVI